MLKQLSIKNYALIVDETIEFTTGLNILMGETGAGKSMIISSLEMLFGARSDSSFVRSGEKKAIIEGIFEIESTNLIENLFVDTEIEYNNDSTIIRREISANGGSRAFVNDTPVSVSFLKSLGDLVIDFHGQHEHQSLLDRSTHIKFLDDYSHDKSILNDYKSKFSDLSINIIEYKKILKQESSYKHQLEYDRFRLEEIVKVDPKHNEYDEFVAQLKVLQNAEFISNTSSSIDYDLYSSEESLYLKMMDVKKRIQSLENFNPEFGSFIEEIETSLISLREVAAFSKNYLAGINFNPEHIEEVRQRLLVLKNLMNKYGSIDEILALKLNLENEINKGENFDMIKYQIVNQIERLKKELGIIAQALHKQRKNASRELAQKIVEKLADLGIANAQFASKYNVTETQASVESFAVEIDNKIYLANENGIDDIEFFISTNLGQAPQALISVASGGEISRIMLSIKSIFAKISKIPILIFDEIDTGISGRIAQQTGLAMRLLSESHQIIAITHLPQIAAIGNANILIEKFEIEDNTYSKSRILNYEEKIEEVAKLISGGNTTVAAKEQALELINAIA